MSTNPTIRLPRPSSYSVLYDEHRIYWNLQCATTLDNSSLQGKRFELLGVKISENMT